MTLKRRRHIDKRLNWRDPNMPVIENGTPKSPEQFQRERIRFLEASQTVVGSRHFKHWRSDPSYNWNRKKK